MNIESHAAVPQRCLCRTLDSFIAQYYRDMVHHVSAGKVAERK